MFEVKNICMIYDMNTDIKTYALKGFDLSLPDKGLVGIIGPSGSGKSTLMYCLSTLKTPTEGSIVYNGKELTSIGNAQRESLRRREFGFIFQKHYDSLISTSKLKRFDYIPVLEDLALFFKSIILSLT